MGIYTEKRYQLIEKIKILEKLRASGLSDSDLLKLVGNGNAGNSHSNSYRDDDISFYDNSENNEE